MVLTSYCNSKKEILQNLDVQIKERIITSENIQYQGQYSTHLDQINTVSFCTGGRHWYLTNGFITCLLPGSVNKNVDVKYSNL